MFIQSGKELADSNDPTMRMSRVTVSFLEEAFENSSENPSPVRQFQLGPSQREGQEAGALLAKPFLHQLEEKRNNDLTD